MAISRLTVSSSRVAPLALAALLVTALGTRASQCASPATPHPVRVATYNVRRFGFEPTDMQSLARVVSSVEADVFALQEVESAYRAGLLADRLSRDGRPWRAVVSTCGGRSGMHLAFVYDSSRLEATAVREYPNLAPDASGACNDGDRPGLLGSFRALDPRTPGAREFSLLTVHFSAGDDTGRARRRREQWESALAIVQSEERAHARPVLVLGDVNSTGWLTGRHEERAFIEGRARDTGREVLTRSLSCSEYYRAGRPGLEPSLLDHVVAPEGLLDHSRTRLFGYCAELACERYTDSEAPTEYRTVSDHCPVRVEFSAGD